MARPEPEPEPTPAPETVTVKGGEDPKTPDPNQVVERRIAAEKELLFWESIKDSEHAADFEAYLEQFPGGTFEALARNRLTQLTNPQEEKPVVQVAVTPDEPEPVVSPEPAEPTPEAVEASLGLERGERRQIQMGLASLGFDPGPADGLFGKRMRTAIGEWQSSEKAAATGYLDVEAAKVLLETGQAAERENEEKKQKEAARRADDAAFASAKSRETAEAYGSYLATHPQGRHVSEARQLLEEAQENPKPFGPNWIVVENQPCQIHKPSPKPGETATWTGACVDGKGSGHGRSVWRGDYGEQTYEGERRDGKKHGQGTKIWNKFTRYKGEWREGKRHGRGHMTWELFDTHRYEGEWRNGKKHGWGTQYSTITGNYEGEWRNNVLLSGIQFLDRRENKTYEGKFRKDGLGGYEPHGKGTSYNFYGDRYTGDFRHGKKHGFGIWTLSSGSSYRGEVRDNGKPHGWGVYTNSKGKVSKGDWVYGCLRKSGGRGTFFATTKEACGFK